MVLLQERCRGLHFLLVTKACHGNLDFVVLVVSRAACCAPPTAFPPCGVTSVPSDAQAGWHREQSAKPVCAVGASLVVLSSFANVFVSLSSVVVFRIVKL